MVGTCRIAILTIFVVIYNALESCNSYGMVNKSEVGGITSLVAPVKRDFSSRGPAKIASSLLKRSAGETGDSSDEFYDYYYQYQEEPECPEEEYFHIRGRKCVPFFCPGGNQYRNKYNGECLLKHYGIVEDTKGRPQRVLNRMSKQTKFRLPFGLTLKG